MGDGSTRPSAWPGGCGRAGGRAGGVGVNTADRNVEASIRGLRTSGWARGVGSYALHAYAELQPIAWAGMSVQACRGAGDAEEVCGG